MNVHQVLLYPPLRGFYLDLSTVPDPVFAEKMAGDGIAIDPLDNVLYAPLSGTIKSIHRAQHAITIAADAGFDVLLHVGLETVTLGGKGFDLKVAEGDQVKPGTILSEFNLDYLAEHAKALITPVLIIDIQEKNLSLKILPHAKISDLKQPIMAVSLAVVEHAQSLPPNDLKEVNHDTQIPAQVSPKITQSVLITMLNQQGIHARPAARLNAIARKYPAAEILLYKGERSANVKSLVSLLGLGVMYRDQIKLTVKGDNWQQIMELIQAELLSLDDAGHDYAVNPNPDASSVVSAGGKYYGVAASTGIAVAQLVHKLPVQFKFDSTATNIKAELDDLEQTLTHLVKQLESTINHLPEFEVEYKNILNAHLMILTDPELNSRAREIIEQGYSAPYAWGRAIDASCEALAATGNTLLIERQSDLRDVRERVLSSLCKMEGAVMEDYAAAVILVAEDFTPSQIIALPPQVKGLVSIYGGITSHVAILARNRGLPLLIGVSEDVLQEPSAMAILDTTTKSSLNSKPSAAEFAKAKEILRLRQQELNLAEQAAYLPALTLDGYRINCLANIGNLEEADLALKNGAEGVGLFRTEFMFLERVTAPSEEEQFQEYSKINQLLQDGAKRELVIRTLDIGGDKPLPYLKQISEENPMLGLRGVRLCLANRELFKTQLRAILRTGADTVKIMLPMVSTLSEYRVVKQIFLELQAELGISAKIQLGIMVEVPAVALLSEIFAQEVDFMSLGTNDLTQYIMAVDREHTGLAPEIDHLDPAVLTAIAATARGANKYATHLSVCGLIASEKLAIPVLLGLGIKNLSMSVTTIAENKALIRKLNLNWCCELAEHCLRLATATEVRCYLKQQLLSLGINV
jgi:phosphoenolpyruvate-protein phosphotransferase